MTHGALQIRLVGKDIPGMRRIVDWGAGAPIADEKDLWQPQVSVEQTLLMRSVADEVGQSYDNDS